MPAATTLNVSAKDSLKTSSLHSPKKRTSQTLKTHKKLSGSRRASMPTLSTSKPETIPEQAEVKSPEASPTQERFLDKVGNKFKLTNTRPMEKDNANKTEEESLRPLLVSTSMRSSGDASTGSKESVSRRARKFLDFVRPPPPRRNVTAEIEETERKMKEQLARTKAIHKKNKDRRRSLQDAKIKQESARELHSPSSHSVASQQQRRRRHSLHTTTPPPQSTPTQQPKPKVQMTTRKPRKEEPVKKINRDAVFNDIIKEEEKDNTSVTEAASFTENSPEPAPAVLWNPDSPENKFKMMILSHAASCREKKGSCPYDPVCSEHQNLLEHIEKCTEDADCTYPRCVPTRNFLVTMRLMEKGGANDASTKDFLVGMGAIAPVPVIDISALSECCKPVSGDWDAFSAVSNTSWWEHAGH